ncbi:type VII secretion protein EccB [Corynebacterium sp.]|uniref:type VII secretion protein EccB n=1 Tax=Corynebacterium sp. TaxID=1720 RepID=UPI0026DD016E|nr:type VII secretion protein EccB [Corynebacterium sp.]MDO5031277.1 type VII secretion protein EccB [Corynebacterium sp.]
MARALPTTKAQVSGHKFLVRRVEHGLVFGDIRMIHDPLATRRRALIFGVIAVAFLSIGSGLVAWLQPDPQPGDAALVRSPEGQLLVQVNEQYHPVANVASARLIAGEAVEPAAAGESFLSQVHLGTPLGIDDAPNLLASTSPGATGWAACFEEPAGAGESSPTSMTAARPEGIVTVVANAQASNVGDSRGAVAEVEGTDWLLTQEGRVALPDPTSTQGRVVRRALGINPQVHVWHIPPQLLNAFTELEPLRFPEQPPQILDSGEGLWARTESGVSPVTATQAEILVGLGAQRLSAESQEIALLGDAPSPFHLPPHALDFLGPEAGWLCAVARPESGAGAALLAPVGSTVELAGDSVAQRFAGLSAGGVAVDSGHGYHVVSATGIRHSVPQAAGLKALGVENPAQVPWEILRLLPEGSELSREAALRAAHAS